MINQEKNINELLEDLEATPPTTPSVTISHWSDGLPLSNLLTRIGSAIIGVIPMLSRGVPENELDLSRREKVVGFFTFILAILLIVSMMKPKKVRRRRRTTVRTSTPRRTYKRRTYKKRK